MCDIRGGNDELTHHSSKGAVVEQASDTPVYLGNILTDTRHRSCHVRPRVLSYHRGCGCPRVNSIAQTLVVVVVVERSLNISYERHYYEETEARYFF